MRTASVWIIHIRMVSAPALPYAMILPHQTPSSAPTSNGFSPVSSPSGQP